MHHLQIAVVSLSILQIGSVCTAWDATLAEAFPSFWVIPQESAAVSTFTVPNAEGESIGMAVSRGDLNEFRSPTPAQIVEMIELPIDPQFDLKSSAKVSATTGVWSQLKNDQLNFYSRDSLIGLGTFVALGALSANTSLDSEISKHFQQSVRRASTDEWFEGLHANKELGNGNFVLPIFALAAATKLVTVEASSFRPVAVWGERSLRGFAVGAVPVVMMQRMVGGSRPGESGIHSSHWRPLTDNNGVSGHSFIGSLPFITAAKMSNSRWQKLLFYSGSTLAPLSRVNDNAHYPSQVLIGWAMAYVAASAVAATDDPSRAWHLVPLGNVSGTGIALERRW